MRIPKSFSTAISNVFYDKEITVHQLEPSPPDAGGYIKYDIGKASSMFKGSVRFNDLKTLQEEYGLSVEINIAVSTNLNTDVALKDILKYNNTHYEVVQCIPFDSALMIVGKLWQR